MAKKSAVKLVGKKDVAQSVERDFLSITNLDDAQKIYYEYDEESSPVPKVEPSTPAQPPSVKTSMALVPVLEMPPVIVFPQPSIAAASVDKEFTPTDVIITLVAQKLRRAFDQVPISASIQTLSAGELSQTS
jgi:fatty acid synthase subunit alpha